MSLCVYADIFGKPNTGVHSYRIPFVDWALVDVVSTTILAYLISWFNRINFWATLIGLILLGIFLHWIFCVRTRLSIQLGLVK